MPRYDACLLDVYETVLSVDPDRHQAALAGLAGVPVADFQAAARAWGPRVSVGGATMAEALTGIVGDCGVEVTPALLDELVAADGRVLQELAEVFPDVVPFLEELRAAGVRTAFVSNCAENTRPMLDALGLSALVDELVLSCDVGAEKPDARIFRAALDRLGVAPERAVLVDDQQGYCDGAAALGIGVVRIDRRDGTGDVTTLAEVRGLVGSAT